MKLPSYVPQSLDQLALQYGTDKSSTGHGYTGPYADHFGYLRHDPVSLLEIGVWRGASIRTWLAYFQNPDARFVGIDIEDFTDPASAAAAHALLVEAPSAGRIEDPRYTFELVDVKLFKPPAPEWDPEAGLYDIVIDDGSHDSYDILKAHKNLWPNVKKGGWYVIEDLAVHGPGSVALGMLDGIMRNLAREWGDVAEVHLYGQIAFLRKEIEWDIGPQAYVPTIEEWVAASSPGVQ